MSKVTAFLLLFGAVPMMALEPSAVVTLSSGELAIFDPAYGIVKVSDTRTTTVVRGFGIFESIGFVAIPAKEGNDFLVTQQIEASSNQLPRLARYSTDGKRTNEWVLPDARAVLADVAVDAGRQIAYVTDARTNTVYTLNVANKRSSFVSLVRVHDAGILGPLALDTKRGRLLVGDVEKGGILSIALGSRKFDVIDRSTIAEPVAMTYDAKNDRLYVADSAGHCVWVGTPSGMTWTFKPFPASQKLRQPTGVAVTSNGSLWVADGKQRLVWLFDRDGKTLRTIKP